MTGKPLASASHDDLTQAIWCEWPESTRPQGASSAFQPAFGFFEDRLRGGGADAGDAERADFE